MMFLSLEDVREAEREKERKRGTSARETEKRRVESLPEEKEKEEGQSGSGNDRPSALEANIDECPALLALRNQQSEERGIALFPFSPPSLASSPTSSTDPPPPPPPPPFRFFSTFGFRLSAFGKRRGINGSPISPLSSRIRRRKPRQRTRKRTKDRSFAEIRFSRASSESRSFLVSLFHATFPRISSRRTGCRGTARSPGQRIGVSRLSVRTFFTNVSMPRRSSNFEFHAAAGRKFGPARQGQSEREETRREETKGGSAVKPRTRRDSARHSHVFINGS